MKMTIRNVCGALLGLTLAACGPATEEAQDTSQQQRTLEAGCTALGSSILNHACVHSNNSADHVSVTATSGLSGSTPSINTAHKQFDVTLPAGAAGTVTFTPGATGSWAFHLTQNVSVTVRNGASTLTPALGHSISGCALTQVVVYDLTGSTTYEVELGSASGDLLGVVAERVEDYTVRYYRDADGDTWGASTGSILTACVPPAGYVNRRFDCNDANASINPSATEVTGNSVDENCNGSLTN